MAVRRLSNEQPEAFAFTAENQAWAEERIATFPEGKQASAVIQLLWRAQEQNEGWLPEPAIRHVADMLDMPFIRVYEVATFYTMFQLKPVGRVAHVQVCGTTPCALRGANDLLKVCRKRISETPFTVTPDGNFSWEEVECLGACANAPLVQIWGDNFEDLTAQQLEQLLDRYSAGDVPEAGPQNSRRSCEPEGGATALTETPAYKSQPLPNLPGSEESAQGAKGGETPTNAKPVEKDKAKDATAPGHPGAPKITVDGIRSPKDVSPDEARAGAASAVSTSKGGGSVGLTRQGVSGGDDATPASDTAALEAEAEEVANKLLALSPDASAEEKADAVGERPTGLDGPRDGKADDLKRIKGVGTINEDRLNALGIYHFDQIANWERPQVRWVTTYLAFPGRIDRENWLGQAAALSMGKDTGFSKRVDAGDVYSDEDAD